MYRVLILRLVGAVAGWIIADKKGRNGFIWAVLSFIFPLMVLVVLILPPKLAAGKTKRCPYCSKIIYEKDTVCRHCQREQPINLVQCIKCKSFVPERDYCTQCNKKL